MSLIRINRTLAPRILSQRKCLSTVAPRESDEYTATPQYPPILDLSPEKNIERKKQAVYDEIKAVKTVEEKQIKLNIPRYYGFKSYMLFEDVIPYDSLKLAQHVTRTHLVKSNVLPEFYNKIEIENVGDISTQIQEALLMEIEGIQKLYDLKNEELTDVERENIIASSIVQQINRVLNNNLAHKNTHIVNNEVDLDLRIESAWYVGGMNPPEHIKSCRRGHSFWKKYENEPTDRLMYYIGSPVLTIRATLPLPLIIPPSEAENPAFDVPFFQYDPRVFGTTTEHRHMANVPGFWPGDTHTFGLVSFLKRGHILERAALIEDDVDNKEALDRQAILSSYAWLHSQANHLGFTTFNDITYPLVTQTVITNGKQFSFYIYQLNTILLSRKNITENPKRNICWGSDELKLYDEVKDGKIVGFNEEVVEKLLRLYCNVPCERFGVNLRPYLSQEEKIIADYEDDDKRQWLEREYKRLTSNRPRHREIDEIYSWEKIYKIDFKTRFVEKRRRFFELRQRPQDKKLTDTLPDYIPRAHRPDLPRYKGRTAKVYWP